MTEFKKIGSLSNRQLGDFVLTIVHHLKGETIMKNLIAVLAFLIALLGILMTFVTANKLYILCISGVIILISIVILILSFVVNKNDKELLNKTVFYTELPDNEEERK